MGSNEIYMELSAPLHKLNPFSHFIQITCNSWLQHALVRHTVVCVLGLLLPYATVCLIHSKTLLCHCHYLVFRIILRHFSSVNTNVFGTLAGTRQGRAKYRVAQKKVSHKVLSISLSNIDRLSKFFQWRILWKICNKVVTKYTTTP